MAFNKADLKSGTVGGFLEITYHRSFRTTLCFFDRFVVEMIDRFVVEMIDLLEPGFVFLKRFVIK